MALFGPKSIREAPYGMVGLKYRNIIKKNCFVCKLKKIYALHLTFPEDIASRIQSFLCIHYCHNSIVSCLSNLSLSAWHILRLKFDKISDRQMCKITICFNFNTSRHFYLGNIYLNAWIQFVNLNDLFKTRKICQIDILSKFDTNMRTSRSPTQKY